jgi:MFS family permease
MLNNLKSTFRALKYPNYRLFFIGQGTSLIGTWMQRVATSWLVYRLTGSAVMLGVVGFVSQIPTFILSPFGGIAADRWNKKTIFLVTQIFAMLQALVLAALVINGSITVAWIIVLNVILGVINAFDITARQSFVVDMIENKEDLGNAIALNSSMVNGARLLGPSITGILIASAGEGVCFFVNSMSYVVIIIAILRMEIPLKQKKIKEMRILHDFKEGFGYVYNLVPMRSILFLLALVSLFGMSYMVLMPVFAKEVLGGGPHTLGFLMGSAGFGALCGAMYLASRKTTHNLSRLIPASAALFGFGIIAASFSRSLWPSLILLAVAGCGMMVQMAASNTLIQVLVDDDKRGRVMALYAMAFMGMAPFGSLLAGSLAGLIGTPHALMAGGIMCVLGALYFSKDILSAKNLMKRPEKEITLEAEKGIESSEEVAESM